MSLQIFTSSANGGFTEQPSASGEKIIVRSTNAADTMNMNVIGSVGGTATAETIALTGTTAVQSTNTFLSLTQAYLSSAPAGSVTVLGQGQKATGSITINVNPVDGATIPVAGGPTYTLKSPEISTVTTVADVAAATSGLYFDAQDKNGPVRCWNNVDGVGVAPAVPGGGRLLPVVYATGDSANTIATAIAAAFEADAQFESYAVTNVVTIYDAALGNRTDIAVGTSTFTVATVSSGAANNVAYRVRIGATLYNTTAAIGNAWLAQGTAGDDWGTGTVANTIWDGYADGAFSDTSWNGTSDQVVYLRDKLAVNRNGTYAVSDTSSGITTVSPTGGSDGAVIALLSASGYQITVAMSLWSPDLATTTLIGLTTPTCDAVQVLGGPCTVHIRAANFANAVVLHLESSDDGSTWANRSADYPLTNADNNQEWQIVADNLEYIRLVVDTNANTTTVALHATVTF